MLTPFGKALRTFRIEQGELLKDMAQKLAVTPAYLSSIENGKKPIAPEFVQRLKAAYDFTGEQMRAIEDAVARTSRQINLALNNDATMDLGIMFARKMDSLSSEQRQQIMEILQKRK